MFSIGSTQTINCDTGFVIHGNDTIKCMENGTWFSLPKCLKVRECTELKIPNATVTVNTTHASVTCVTGFVSNKTKDFNQIITTETFKCDEQGNWSPNMECTHYNNIKNVALHKNVTHNSTFECKDAGIATDGKWDCKKYRGDHCSQRSPIKTYNAWWEVDLCNFYSVKRVSILDKDDQFGTPGSYKVFVGNKTNPMIPCKYPMEVHGDTISCTCNSIVGRNVKVENQNNRHLTLCEVGVYED
ncbi:uncharacterized protein LOC132743797 [Ruditapes philippinarum]|uniref:uncharacterized protein LOC132743797 n=1 Tax=Ruditapes philippinarum TaxID=129788 RepID=UPI00295A6FB2|nr:uncharacterized protein LOC132743797 [Ruditapes philippinarum]